MKTITVSSNLGRFATSASAQIGDDVNDATTELCKSGLLNELFRQGGSAGEKALLEFLKLPKETKRADIPYSDEAAEVLAKAMMEF